MALSVTGITIETVQFPPSVKPPGSTKTLFLSGAGVRDGQRDGKYTKFSAVSVYLEDKAVPWLAAKWKGKTAEELTDSVDFLKDVVGGPFEKLLYVTALVPIFGEKWTENQKKYSIAHWESLGIYTEAEATALEKFHEAMKAESIPPGSSVFLTLSPHGSFRISFSKDGSVPKAGKAVIENKLLTEEVLGVIIRTNGVSPSTRKSVVARLAELINNTACRNVEETGIKQAQVQNGKTLAK